MRLLNVLLMIVLAMVAECAGAIGVSETTPSPIVIENASLQIVLGADGARLRFIDKATGTDYLDQQDTSHVASAEIDGQNQPATSATYADGQLELTFATLETRATIKVERYPSHLILEVIAVSDNVDSLTFLNIPLTLTGSHDEAFAACALALNLQTKVSEIPGASGQLRASAYRRFGIKGARVALVGCPSETLRDAMKEVVSKATDIPQSDIGGPWALDAPINRGSYLFDFGDCTEETVDEWIALAQELGITQIDFHTGRSLRFGDYRPDPKLFPRGRESVKAVLDKLEQAGIAAGLHTYAFFIAKDTPYVTPVPDPRLGKDATFTLAADIKTETDQVAVVESTDAMSTTTGFFVRNSVTIQIDNELITYSGIAKEAPYAFTGCTRGAYGTEVAEHRAGAPVYHLKECFGLFTPDADSTLLAEIAHNTADVFNACGFDMIYLDALDGEDILGGKENGWHYGSKFVWEIADRLEKPALFEMSTFHHHLWYVRARMGAWDHPNRSHKQFIDIHCAANKSGAGMFLPMNLGWWAVKTWTGARREPTFPDDIEYLMGKCLGNGFGFALMGVNPDNIARLPAFQRLAPIFRQYEALRHADYFSDEMKEKLCVPGDEYTLEQQEEGEWRFRPVRYAKHKVRSMDEWSNTWTSANEFAAQPLRLRIEALKSAAPYDSEQAVFIEDFSAPANLKDRMSQPGVSASLVQSTQASPVGGADGLLTVTNEQHQANGAWMKLGKTFSPELDLSKTQGLGLWVQGDGKGEVINLQLMSPGHISHGIGDHYIKVDFTGWRYVELIEHEGHRISEYDWPYGGNYAIYREDVDFGHIESFAIWCNLVPENTEVAVRLSPIKAVPVVPNTLRNPAISIGGRTLTFPVEMESGSYLEFNAPDDCKHYDSSGKLLAELTPVGPVPVLDSGDNVVTFVAKGKNGLNPRAQVVLISQGESLPR